MDPHATPEPAPEPTPDPAPLKVLVTTEADPNPQVIARLGIPGRAGEIEVWWAHRASMTDEVAEEFVDLTPDGRPGVFLLVIAHDVLGEVVERAFADGADVDDAVLEHVIARGAHFAAIHLTDRAA